MPRPLPVEAYTQPGEETLAIAGRHPRSIIAGILFATLFWAIMAGAAAFLFQQVLDPEHQPFLAPTIFIFSVLWLVGSIRQWWRMRTSRYVITPERVYASRGRLFFTVQQTTYDKVTDLHIRQSLFGRWWGYGDVTVQTAGTGLSFTGVPHPLDTKKTVETARTAFLARLIEEYRLEGAMERPAGTAGAQGTPGGEEVVPPPEARESGAAVWRGRPVLVSALATIGQGVLLFLVGLGVLAGGILGDTQLIMLLIGGALVFFGFSGLVQGWVHYKFTRYEVHSWGVVVTSGWLTRRRVEITYDKVTDVTTYQGFIARILNFGSITINTAGSSQAPVSFSGLDDPEAVKAIIDDTRRSRAATRRRGA